MGVEWRGLVCEKLGLEKKGDRQVARFHVLHTGDFRMGWCVQSLLTAKGPRAELRHDARQSVRAPRSMVPVCVFIMMWMSSQTQRSHRNTCRTAVSNCSERCVPPDVLDASTSFTCGGQMLQGRGDVAGRMVIKRGRESISCRHMYGRCLLRRPSSSWRPSRYFHKSGPGTHRDGMHSPTTPLSTPRQKVLG